MVDLKDSPFENCKSVSLPGMPVLYYKPRKHIGPFGEFEVVPIDTDLINKYFITDENTVYGYYAGVKALNDLHGTTQMPRIIDIRTNKTDKHKEIECAGALYRINKAKREVTSENYIYLEILDAIEEWYDYFEEDRVDCIKYVVKELRLEKSKFRQLLNGYSGRTVEVIENVFA